MNIKTARGIAARIWADSEYSKVAMNVDLANKIAYLLMREANRQTSQQRLKVLAFGVSIIILIAILVFLSGMP